jgi:hypothetical protein
LRRRILVINDIHVGSIHSICSAKPTAEGKPYQPNRSQRRLLKGWKQCIKMIGEAPDVIVVNGEPTDGNNRKGYSKELWSQSLVDQVRDFTKLFEMLPREDKTKVYLTRGSAYHVDIEGTPIEEFAGDYINAETYHGHKANYHLQLKVNGQLISFAHETGYSKNYPARGNKLAAEWTTHAASVGKISERWNLSVRAHIHQINERSFGPKWRGITCPCWKYNTGDYFERHGPSTTPVDIGMTLITVEDNGTTNVEFLIPDDVSLKEKIKVL